MNNKVLALIAGFALAMTWASGAQAIMFEDVEVPDAVTLSGETVPLNGVGVREKFWVNVYVGALYLPEQAHSLEAAVSQKGPKRIAMYFQHDAGREAIVEAWTEGFESNNDEESLAAIAKRIEKFKSFFGDIAEGEVVFLDYLPGIGTRVTIAGEVKGTIEGREFYTALMRIWLGPNPPGEDLKEGMLGLD